MYPEMESYTRAMWTKKSAISVQTSLGSWRQFFVSHVADALEDIRNRFPDCHDLA